MDYQWTFDDEFVERVVKHLLEHDLTTGTTDTKRWLDAAPALARRVFGQTPDPDFFEDPADIAWAHFIATFWIRRPELSLDDAVHQSTDAQLRELFADSIEDALGQQVDDAFGPAQARELPPETAMTAVPTQVLALLLAASAALPHLLRCGHPVAPDPALEQDCANLVNLASSGAVSLSSPLSVEDNLGAVLVPTHILRDCREFFALDSPAMRLAFTVIAGQGDPDLIEGHSYGDYLRDLLHQVDNGFMLTFGSPDEPGPDVTP
ncbi:hypothetical protein [Dietzia sp. 179-F 9C3 NHS]|uniref:hypothetical protein n=1 Tax=Dietzia sp. 179-F 9C3 NHS TaxID=3374295 RepID=UPI00387A12FE